jgi:spore cortex biosynthesis protein YabQ
MLTIHGQVFYFLFSCLCGIIMGFIYDLFRVKRLLFKTKKIYILIDDLFYWMIMGSFLLLGHHHVLKGQLRFFMLLGLILGTILYMMTLSKLIIRFFYFLTNLIRKPFDWILKTFPKKHNPST